MAESLPISSLKGPILAAVKQHGVTILVGATGSGKSTQTVQFLLEAGWSAGGRLIGCTQPRRVAAASLAVRVRLNLHI